MTNGMSAGQLSSFCGPAVIASVFGVTRTEASQEILKVQRVTDGSVDVHTLCKVLGLLAESVDYDLEKWEIIWDRYKGRCEAFKAWARSRGDYPCPGFPNRPTTLKARPTLTAWLRSHLKGEYVVRTGHHFVHVRDGEIVECNGLPAKRGRVTHYITIT